jgi:hypothetical protein
MAVTIARVKRTRRAVRKELGKGRKQKIRRGKGRRLRSERGHGRGMGSETVKGQVL